MRTHHEHLLRHTVHARSRSDVLRNAGTHANLRIVSNRNKLFDRGVKPDVRTGPYLIVSSQNHTCSQKSVFTNANIMPHVNMVIDFCIPCYSGVCIRPPAHCCKASDFHIGFYANAAKTGYPYFVSLIILRHGKCLTANLSIFFDQAIRTYSCMLHNGMGKYYGAISDTNIMSDKCAWFDIDIVA